MGSMYFEEKIMKTTSLVGLSAVAVLVLATGVAAKTFTYHSYGGFLDTAGGFEMDPSSQYLPGYDGPWFREGVFSAPVSWGDQTNQNKRDPNDPFNAVMDDNNDSWPAVSWGRNGNFDPWIDELASRGGSSGLGLTGYGYGTMGTIVTDDDSIFVPLGALTHINNPLDFYGSAKFTMSWNFQIYDGVTNVYTKDGAVFYIYQWETHNTLGSHGGCPRELTPAGSIVNDLAFNTADTQHEDVGLNHDFVSDGKVDTLPCADPFAYEGTYAGDSFVADGKTYQISVTGFYEYNLSDPDCNVSYDYMYQTPGSWDAKCFYMVPTFWSDEGSHNTGYVRISIHEEGGNEGNESCTPGYWRNSSKKTPLGHNWPEGYAPGDSLATAFGLTGGSGAEICVGKNCVKHPEDLVSVYAATLGQAINVNGGTMDQLTKHATAALFNAAGMEYFTSLANVKTLYACAIGDDSVTPAQCSALGVVKGDAEGIFNMIAGWNEVDNCPLDNSDNGN